MVRVLTARLDQDHEDAKSEEQGDLEPLEDPFHAPIQLYNTSISPSREKSGSWAYLYSTSIHKEHGQKQHESCRSHTKTRWPILREHGRGTGQSDHAHAIR